MQEIPGSSLNPRGESRTESEVEVEIRPEGISTDSLRIEDGVIDHIVSYSKGDARVALNVLGSPLQYYSDVIDGKKNIDPGKSVRRDSSPTLFYDKTGDQHYDILLRT